MIDNLKFWKLPIQGTFISVDPGTGGTGLALFQGEKKIPDYTVLLEYNLNLPSWKDKCDKILEKTKTHFQIFKHSGYCNCPVFIEEPQFFDSYKGLTAARDNSLAKLIFFYGRFWQIVEDLGFQCVAVPIPKYKGQLTKPQVQERIKNKIGLDYSSHVADAVYVGLWLRGIVK